MCISGYEACRTLLGKGKVSSFYMHMHITLYRIKYSQYILYTCLLSTLARSNEDIDSTLGYFQSKLREMEQVKEELQCAKGEIQIFHETFAKYEYDISRYKLDIGRACGQVEHFKRILRENNINVDEEYPS